MKKFLKKLKSLFWGEGKLGKVTPVFVVLMIVSTTSLLVSNIIANKLFPLFGWTLGGFELTLTCGVLCFPISYITSDLFSECFGYKWSRVASWIAFAANAMMVIIFCLADIIPGTYYQTEILGYTGAFHSVLGIDFASGWGPFGTLIASLLAFIFGSLIDDVVFEKMRKKQKSKEFNTGSFIMRAVSSSFMGELVDSIIFIPFMLLFAGLLGTQITSIWQVVGMILIQVTIKTAYELVISPLTALIAKKIKKYEANNVA